MADINGTSIENPCPVGITSHPERVSVIIPARNEAANIARVVRSLAKQKDVAEILVVDDQSTDGTGAILAALEAELPVVRGLRVESLPEGWMGKTYAADLGARAATGDWLLFTDADTEHSPGSLAELLRRAEIERADLLSLSPGQETRTWWEKAVIPLVFVQLSSLFRFEDVSDPRSPAAAANGQYILVRKNMYELSGGHAAVRTAILEDVELARRLKSLGGRLLFLPGAQWVRTRMYASFGEMWEGWTKNLYLLYGGDVFKMLVSVGFLWLKHIFPALALILASLVVVSVRSGNWTVVLLVATLLLVSASQWSYRRALRRLGFDPALAKYQPLGAVLLGALLLGSLRAHRSRGSIKWKGRSYATKGSE